MNSFAFMCLNNNCEGLQPFLIALYVIVMIVAFIVLTIMFSLLGYIACRVHKKSTPRNLTIYKELLPYFVGYILFALIFYITQVSDIELFGKEELVIIPMVVLAFSTVFYLHSK
jgi:hypothetical protein